MTRTCAYIAIPNDRGQQRADGGHPAFAQGEDLVQGWAGVAVAGGAGVVGHFVVRQVERIPRGRLAEDGTVHPGVGGEDQVAQRLDERPLAVHPLVQRLGVQPAGADQLANSVLNNRAAPPGSP